MRKKRLLLTLIITIAAVIISCSISFGSNAVVDSGGYTHPPQFSNTIVIDGVDVSVWQYDIDWEKVKRQGIDYAFIRVGYSGLDSPFSINQDRYFEQNYQKAREAGLMVGVYYYSTATSLTEAQKEAKFVLDVLNNRELDLPVVYDFELQTGGRLYKSYYNWDASSRKAKAASNSLTFLNYIEKNSGYRSMFYSYRAITSPYMNPGGNKIDMGLIEQKYPVWLAQYSSDNSYERPYEYWQYTSSGSVTGINGNTDCNFWYYNNAAEKTLSGTTSIKDASVQLSRTSYEYTKFQKRPTVTVTYGGKTLKKGTDYKVYYIKNVLAGTGYAMIRGTGSYSNTKLVPFEITKTDIADGGTANNIADKTYTGDAFKPSPKVYYKTTLLKKNVDYTISYANNTDAGTAKVTINGKRNYYGSFTKTFKINKADPTFTGYTSYSRKTDSPDWKINTKVNSGAALTYKSSDTSIASVDSEGKVTLKGKEGIVYITVTSLPTKTTMRQQSR